VVTSSLPIRRSNSWLFVLAGASWPHARHPLRLHLLGAEARVPAQRILQSVAAGLLGDASFEGGAATAALGLALHFLIATSMSVRITCRPPLAPALAAGPALRRCVRPAAFTRS